jgi:hypothetical protein
MRMLYLMQDGTEGMMMGVPLKTFYELVKERATIVEVHLAMYLN